MRARSVRYWPGSKAKAWRLSAVAALAAALAAVYGVSDELHQSFVPGRTADGADVVADAVGAVLGAGAGTWTLAALDRWARGAGAHLALARWLRRPASRCSSG